MPCRPCTALTLAYTGLRAGDAADGRRAFMSAPGSRAMSPAAGAVASAAALQRSASAQAAAAQVPAAAPASAASVAAGGAAGGLQVTPLHRPAAAAAQAAAGGLAVTPLPGMQPRHSAAPTAGEITPMQQQPLRGAEAAADVAQRLQRLGVTPMGGSTPVAAAGQRQQAEQQQQPGALTPLERLAAAPVDLNITPLVAPPAGRQLAPAAAAVSGRRQAAAPPPPLDITPLAGGAAAADRRSQLCISPLPGMEPEPQQVGSASPKGRSVLAERTNSGRPSPGAVPLTSGRRGMLPSLASPLPVEPGMEQPPLHGSPSFAENQPLPSPAAGGQQQPGGVAAGEKVKAAGAEAQAALTPAGSGVQWTIPTAPADAEMAEAAPSGGRAAAGLASHTLEFSFAAAQRSLDQLSSGAAWGGGSAGSAPGAGIAEAAAGLPPGLRDDILALHWDMLQQFQVGGAGRVQGKWAFGVCIRLASELGASTCRGGVASSGEDPVMPAALQLSKMQPGRVEDLPYLVAPPAAPRCRRSRRAWASWCPRCWSATRRCLLRWRRCASS